MRFHTFSQCARLLLRSGMLVSIALFHCVVQAQDASSVRVIEAPAPAAIPGVQLDEAQPDATGFALEKDVWKSYDPCCLPCGPPGDYWIRAEYLAWWMQGAQAPPLVTSAVPPNEPILGQPGTTVVFGGDRLNGDLQSGFRVRGGMWCDDCRTCGLELGFFMIGDDDRFRAVCPEDGSIVFGRPFIDARTGLNEAQLICPGEITVNASSDLLGADALLRHNLCCDPWYCSTKGDKSSKDGCNSMDGGTRIRRDLLIGFSYLRYDDELTIRETLTPFPDAQIDLRDSFRAQNDFYGMKIGLACERYRGRWSLEARPQVSFGVLDRRVSIRGNTVVTYPPILGIPPQEYQGGLLALSSNIGTYDSSQFVVVPQLDLQIGYLVRPNLRLLAGYSFLYIPDLARAAEQIDPVVNPELIPPVTPPITGPQRPAYLGRHSDAWVQGLTFGAEWRF